VHDASGRRLRVLVLEALEQAQVPDERRDRSRVRVLRGPDSELHRFGLMRLENEDPETTAARVMHHLGLCLSDHNHSVLVADSWDGHLTGYLSVHWLPYLFLLGPEGYVSELFVHEHHRGNGIGSALLDTVIREARRRGCARLMLSAVRTRDSYERGFYTERGWTERPDVANMVYEL
jgi:GNAT superfamily N-acetyltransferase